MYDTQRVKVLDFRRDSATADDSLTIVSPYLTDTS